VRRRVGGAVAAAAALAALLAGRQAAFDPGAFELGRLRSVEGVIREHPYPSLEVARPGPAGGAAVDRSRYDLVASGKRGGQREVEGFDGRRARVSGSLIYRDELTMIEVAPGGALALDGGVPPPLPRRELGHYRLVGEIVDSKCYLGVMKPGRTKVHRDCALRCLAGGIPPLLVVEDGAGGRLHLRMVGAGGGPIDRRLLAKVGEPVEVSGRVERLGEALVLVADPAGVRSLE
jgi:hypothetical protein